MWNSIWVTAETERVEAVINKFREQSILVKKKTVFDGETCFYEIYVPAAETEKALCLLAEM